jgi:ABC-type sugar transport system substrate-binding protein
MVNRPSMVNRRLAALGAAVIAATMVLAGCSSSSSSSGGSSTSSTSTSSAAADSGSGVQAKAKAKAAQYENLSVNYPGPTTPVNPGTGKAEVLSCGNTAPVCEEQSADAVTALKAMGWSVPPATDGQTSPQVESAFMERAIQHKDNAVILIAVNVNTIASSVQAAAAAGMTIMCTQCLSGPQWAGKVYDVTADFHAQGEIEAWKVIADKGDKAKVFGTTDPQFSSAVAKAQGLKDGITANCPGCTITITSFPSGTASEPGPPEFTAFLASHPPGTVDYYVPHFDGLAVPIATTMQNAGRTDFLIGGTDGSTAGLNKLATANPPMAFDVVEAFTYEEWCAADLIARIKAKAPLWTGYSTMPSTLVDSTNIKQFMAMFPDESPAPAGYQAKFEKLWGKS